MSLFSKSDDEGGIGEGGQKPQKIDDVFYERPQVRILFRENFLFYLPIRKSKFKWKF